MLALPPNQYVKGSRLTDQQIFFQDETPERLYDPDAFYEGFFYLHINGEIIYKNITYQFSEDCMYYDDGMVAHIWKNVTAQEVIDWLNEGMDRKSKGNLTDEGMAFITGDTIPRFEKMLSRWDDH